MMLLTDADMPIRQGEQSRNQGHMGQRSYKQTFALLFGICQASMKKHKLNKLTGFSFGHCLIQLIN